MGWFDDETGIEPLGDGRFATRLTSAWNIGESANGGYALSPVLRSLRDVGGHRDPISVTTHFLRPVQIAGDASPAEVRSDAIRRGRTTSVARGTLVHDARERLTVVAAFGDLGDVSGESDITRPAPCIPEPDHCLDRSGLEQGVGLPILGRLDVRIHPDRAVAGGSPDAVMEGWIRFADGSPPSTLALPLFADAFPPSLYPRFGRVGWVPTVELTVHVRRRPVAGWVQARLECDDLTDGRMIETGSLWDSAGSLVARSRQLGLLLA